MSSAWNWLGIIVWLLIFAYFFWIVDNVHSRKKTLLKTALNNRKHELTTDIASRNFEITAFEVIVLFVLLFGMGKMTFRHHITNNNSIVTSRIAPLSYTHTKRSKKHPFAKVHYYYVEVIRSRARDFKQNYRFMANGKNAKASNSNSVIVTRISSLRRNPNLAHMVSYHLFRKMVRANHAHKAWVIQFSTCYRNNVVNGLGMHAGQKKFYYTVIKVPKHSDVYSNPRKLVRRKSRQAMK